LRENRDLCGTGALACALLLVPPLRGSFHFLNLPTLPASLSLASRVGYLLVAPCGAQFIVLRSGIWIDKFVTSTKYQIPNIKYQKPNIKYLSKTKYQKPKTKYQKPKSKNQIQKPVTTRRANPNEHLPIANCHLLPFAICR
jgi:hypothetical protein